MFQILTGIQFGYENDVTIGKKYNLIDNGSCFYDDLGVLRGTGPYAWKTPKPELKPKLEAKLTRKQIVAKSKAFGVQEGGTHYTDMELQPLEATYLRYGLFGLKAAIHTKVDKYTSRKKDDEVGQLKKAHHCLAILVEITELESNANKS